VAKVRHTSDVRRSRLIGAAAALVLVVAAQGESAETERGGANVRCERRAVASAVARFTFLVAAGRYSDTAALWLPRRRLPTPGFFAILGRNIRAARGAEVPVAARRWADGGRRHVELLQIDPRVNERESANYGYAMAWFAQAPGSAWLGEGKGVWDCERRRIAMFVGSERSSAGPPTNAPIETEEDARAAVAGRCGRRARHVVRVAEQDVVLCGPVRSRG